MFFTVDVCFSVSFFVTHIFECYILHMVDQEQVIYRMKMDGLVISYKFSIAVSLRLPRYKESRDMSSNTHPKP